MALAVKLFKVPCPQITVSTNSRTTDHIMKESCAITMCTFHSYTGRFTIQKLYTNVSIVSLNT
jgi:hypothetical protein